MYEIRGMVTTYVVSQRKKIIAIRTRWRTCSNEPCVHKVRQRSTIKGCTRLFSGPQKVRFNNGRLERLFSNTDARPWRRGIMFRTLLAMRIYNVEMRW